MECFCSLFHFSPRLFWGRGHERIGVPPYFTDEYMRPGKVRQAQNLMDRITAHSARMKGTAMIGRSPTKLMVCLHTHFSILVPRVRVPFPSEVGNNSKVGKKAPKEAGIFVLFFFLSFLPFCLVCLFLETVSSY